MHAGTLMRAEPRGVSVGVGVEAEFAAVFREAYDPLVRTAYLIVGSRAQAEEVVQDVFVAALKRWETIEVPRAYLRTSTVNACRSLLRRRTTERRLLEKTIPVTVMSVGPEDPLVDALATLSERQRVAVVLRYYEDRSEAEIAAALGCAQGTVKSLLSRALEQLRGSFQEWRTP
jgi:RNA polymerase sigma-70 factor (sigma-E family)